MSYIHIYISISCQVRSSHVSSQIIQEKSPNESFSSDMIVYGLCKDAFCAGFKLPLQVCAASAQESEVCRCGFDSDTRKFTSMSMGMQEDLEDSNNFCSVLTCDQFTINNIRMVHCFSMFQNIFKLWKTKEATFTGNFFSSSQLFLSV